MCTVSMIYDHYYDKWKDSRGLPIPPVVWPPIIPTVNPYPHLPPVPSGLPTTAELEEFRALLERARKYDREHNQPDCDNEEKKRKIKELADSLGVAIDFV